MILKIVISVGVLIALVVVLAALKPRTFRIQRSIRIDAAPDRVFPLINDLHNWARWAPQDREDSSMKRTYSGSAIGVGAVSDWTGSGSSGPRAYVDYRIGTAAEDYGSSGLGQTVCHAQCE